MTSNLGSAYLVDPTLSEPDKRGVGPGGGPRVLQAGVPQPARRGRHLRRPQHRRARRDRRAAGAGLATRLRDRRITLEVTPAAREWLALAGYDPAYGARPLRRLIQREIGDRLARALLGEIRDGQVVGVDLDESGTALRLR